MKPTFIIFCLLTLDFQYHRAQNVLFTRQPDLLNPVSGFAAFADCATDMNGDFLDDVVRVGNKGIYIDIQQPSGNFNQYFYNLPLSAVPSWSICAGDIDNNGFTDLLLADLGQVSFVTANIDGSFYTERLMPDSVFSQRSTMADVNNDGWLDAFICDDLDQSAPFRNQGYGEMVKDTQLIRTTDQPGNYSAIWTDFDNDGDADLYITKCLAGALPGDVRRTNQLYRRNSDGSFFEMAALAGLDDNAQSWSTVFEDFDNDGDMDAFIVNHDMQNRLYRNNGDGTFTDVISGSGVNPDDLGAWENASGDFNNDGFMDIFSGLENELYLGNGNLTFTGVDAPVIPGAIADLNHDGFLDVVKGGQAWINDGNMNHWIKVNLRGLQSNRSGIGAKIELFGPWGVQVREVRSGQSFSPMGSLSAHFGLGQELSADSMVIRWPSGIITSISHLLADSTYLIPEASCILPTASLIESGADEICEGDSTTLLAPEGYTDYVWSTNDTTSSLVVNYPGYYYAILMDDSGCAGTTHPREIKLKNEVNPSIFSPSGNIICQGDTLILYAQGGEQYTWSNGSMNVSEMRVTASGTYTVAAAAKCKQGQLMSDTFKVTALPAPPPMVNDDVILLPGDSILLMATGDQCAWYDQPDGGNLLGTSCTLQTTALNESTSYYVENLYDYPGEIQDGGKKDTIGAGGPALQSGYLLFEAWEPFELISVDVYVPEGSPQGTRFIQLWSGDSLLQSKSFSVVTGLNQLSLSFPVPVGSHSLRCPQGNLFRNTGSLDYPFPIGNVGRINSSSFGEGYYFDLYNWKIKTRDIHCVSSRQEINVIISGLNPANDPGHDILLPNPTHGTVNIDLTDLPSQYTHLKLLSSSGEHLLTHSIEGEKGVTLDIHPFPSGVYFVQLTGKGTPIIVRILKI
jgi:hypothetical protein